MSQRLDFRGKRWRARYQVGGERIVRTFSTEAEARAWVDLAELRRAAMTFPALLDRLNVTPAGCWEWQGHVTARGYGRLMLDGRKVYAHRVLLALRGTAIPAGYHVHHACRNTRCVNPDHLEILAPVEHRARHRENKNGSSVVHEDGV